MYHRVVDDRFWCKPGHSGGLVWWQYGWEYYDTATSLYQADNIDFLKLHLTPGWSCQLIHLIYLRSHIVDNERGYTQLISPLQKLRLSCISSLLSEFLASSTSLCVFNIQSSGGIFSGFAYKLAWLQHDQLRMGVNIAAQQHQQQQEQWELNVYNFSVKNSPTACSGKVLFRNIQRSLLKKTDSNKWADRVKKKKKNTA